MKTVSYLVAISLLFISCHTFGLTISGDDTRCFSEHMDEYVLTKGKFQMTDKINFSNDKTNVDVTVYDPNQKVIYHNKDIKKGKFYFNTPFSGTYTTCFKNNNKFDVDMFFKYKFGIEAKDYSHLAQFQNLEEVEVQTQWIIDSLYEVQDNIDIIQQHDNEIREIAMDLDNKLIVFSGITILVLIILSVFQTCMLKRRLIKAKLL